MLSQIVRGDRWRPPFEAGGSANHRKTEVPGDRDRDHVLVDLFTQSDACITIGDYILQPIFADNFNVDVGIGEEQGRQLWPEYGLGRVLDSGDANSACWLVAHRAERGDLAF